MAVTFHLFLEPLGFPSADFVSSEMGFWREELFFRAISALMQWNLPPSCFRLFSIHFFTSWPRGAYFQCDSNYRLVSEPSGTTNFKWIIGSSSSYSFTYRVIFAVVVGPRIPDSIGFKVAVRDTKPVLEYLTTPMFLISIVAWAYDPETSCARHQRRIRRSLQHIASAWPRLHSLSKPCLPLP